MKKTNENQSITIKQLLKADRSVPVPFQLNLLGNENNLLCEKVVRIIPRKRLVAFGTWNNEPVVAKLFYDPSKAERNFDDDLSGIEALETSGVPTPKVLFKGVSEDKRIYVLIFQRIFDAQSLEEIWQQKQNAEELESIMRLITIELATQHVLGIVQRDLHLKNFLVAPNKIYTLDGGSIDQEDGILPKEQSLQHLALFFSQLGVGTEKLRENLFEEYVKARGWIVRPADCEYLQKALKKYNKSRWERFQKKIFRDSSAYVYKQTAQRKMMYDREYASEEFLNFLKNPEAIFSQTDIQILKNGRSSTVVKVRIGNQLLVIKRYNLKNVWHWLRRCLRPTRATMSWRLAHLLRLFGVPTAKPVAFIENQFLGLRGTSYFVMDYIAGEDLGSYFTNHANDEKQCEMMAQQVMKLLNNLAKLNITHGDLKMTNILIENQRPVLIDLDGMIEHKTWYSLHRAWKKELNRFMRNWDNRPAIRTLFEKISK